MPSLRRPAPSLLIAALLTLAGCQHTPVPTGKSLAPASFPSSGTAKIPPHWWRTFKDPALDDLVSGALADNRSLRATRARLTQARELARREGASRWPSLQASGEATRQRDDQGNTDALFTAGASASWEVDLWGRVDANADAARLDAEASAATLRDAAISLSAEVARAWYELMESRQQTQLLRNQLKTNKQVEQLAQLRFHQGQVGIADVLRQRQLVEQTHASLVDASRQQDTLTLQLAVLEGQTPGSWKPPSGSSLPALPPQPDTGLPLDLLRRRPDVRAARLQLKAADRRVAAAVADRFPRLTLSAGINDSAASAGNLFRNWLANLTGNLVMPLIDAGQRRAEVRRNKAVVREALNNYEQTMLQAIHDVEDALSAERHQHDKVKSLQQQLELANSVLEQLRGRYTRGAADYLDVLDALLSQQQLQRQLLTARRLLLEDRVTLYRTLAGGWSADGTVEKTDAAKS